MDINPDELNSFIAYNRLSRMKSSKENPGGVKCIGNWWNQQFKYKHYVLDWQVSMNIDINSKRCAILRFIFMC